MTLQITLSDTATARVKEALAGSTGLMQTPSDVVEEAVRCFLYTTTDLSEEQNTYWREEIARRIARIESGEEKMLSMEEVFGDILENEEEKS